MPTRRPRPSLLYVMIKPPLAARDACVACRKAFGICLHYGANRFHCTMLRLGEWAAWSEDRLAHLMAALDGFAFDPFFVLFDRIESGNGRHVALKARHRLREPGEFHRALRDHLAAAGIAAPGRNGFNLHLSLAYRGPHTGGPLAKKTPVAPIGWWVDGFELVHSVWGDSRHDVLGRWQLAARQIALPLGDMLFRPQLAGAEPAAVLPVGGVGILPPPTAGGGGK